MSNSRSKGRSEKLRSAVPAGDCPLCRQKLPSDKYMHTKDFQIVVRQQHVAELSMMEARLFQILEYDRGGNFSVQGLCERLYSSNGGPRNAQRCTYHFLMNLRRKIKPLGIIIASNVRAYYRLDFV